MNTFTRGIGTPAIVAIVAIVLVAGTAIYYNTRPAGEMMMDKGKEMMEEGEAMKKDGEAMMEEGESMMEEGEKMMEKGDGAMMEKEESGAMMEKGYEGAVLGGGADGAVLLDFTKEDYDRAVASGKLVTLYFYANWCPSCKIEFPKMQQAFDELGDAAVVGFRVNYNDSHTDSEEKELAREFGVAYQHTKVFLRDGEKISKSPESWNKDNYITQINNAL